MFGSPRKGRQPGDEVVHQGDYNRGRDPLTLSRWPARVWLVAPRCITFLATTPRQPVLSFCFFIDSFNHHRNLKASGAAAAFHLLSRRLDLRVFFNTRSIPLNLKLSAAAGLSSLSFKQNTLLSKRYRSDFLRQPKSSKCNSPLLPPSPSWPSLPALPLSPSHTVWLSCPA